MTPRTLLLRSSWQTINIGDIAHTPGMLHLIEKHLPGVEVILWPKSLDRGVEPMLRNRFPSLRIVRDAPHWRSPQPRPSDPTIAEAIQKADFWLQGSGSGINEAADLERWRAQSGNKPYGAVGVSVGVVIGIPDQKEAHFPPTQIPLLNGASFLFTRETRSLTALKEASIHCPNMEFAPDAAWAIDLRNEAAAETLLKQRGLEPERFVCFIPRLRLTPYWEQPGSTQPPDEVARKKAVNAQNVEADHAKMRTAIIAWVRRTGNKVLLCPEMTYQTALFRPYLIDPLPDDVKPHVVSLNRYWLTDEALSVYRRARAVVSMECHSPILANAVGRPGFYLRQPEDTWKGQMYPDLGLGDWKFEIASATGEEIAARLLHVHTHYDEALALAKRAAALAAMRHAAAMKAVAASLIT